MAAPSLQKPSKRLVVDGISTADDVQLPDAWGAGFMGNLSPNSVQPTQQQAASPAAADVNVGVGFGGLMFATAAAAPAAAAAKATTAPAATSTLPSATKAGMVVVPSWISSLTDSILKADMSAAAADGTVTEAEMAKLFTDLGSSLTTSKATLSSSQFTDLKTISADLAVGETASSYLTYVTNALVNGNAANAKWTGGAASASVLGNLSVGATATQVNELDGKWFLGTDLPSCTVQLSGSAAFTVTYKASSSPLFAAGGPSVNDVNQGHLGDCYLLSSLAEVAKQNPSLIQSMITDNGNNTYGVRFFVNGAAEYVTVNNSLANGGTIFNNGPDLWASLIEKAYAQAQSISLIAGTNYNYGNSFTTIGNGGYAEYALGEITGASQITDFYASGSSWSKYVYNSSLSTQSTAFGLSTGSVLATLVADLAKGDDLILSSWTNATDAVGKTTLVASHAMSIYGYDSATGNLQIRNPWGTAGGQYWDTTFEVSLATLLADGDTITVDNVGAATTVAAPILLAQTASQMWAAGQKISFTLPSGTFIDPQGQALTYSAKTSTGAALPSWLTFNATTATFTGTVPNGMTAFGLTVTATDTSGLSVSETFNITPPAAPILVAQTATTTETAGAKFTYTLASNTFTDPNGSALTLSATLSNGTALPSWLTFNAATATFSGTAPSTVGLTSVAVKATDAYGLSVTDTFSFSSVAPKAPILVSQTAGVSVTTGKAFSYTVAAGTFTDPNGSALTYSATLSNGTALPSWLTFNAATDTFSGTPTTAGTTTVSLKVTDTYGLSVTENFSFTAAAPSGPVLANQTANQTWTLGQSVSFALAANTFTDTKAMTYSAFQYLNPGDVLATGWLRFNAATDTFSGTVAANESGILHLGVTATDSTGAKVTDYFDISFKNQQGIKVGSVSSLTGQGQQAQTMLAAS
jgi:Calpain family cysteine protease/Putative Ig domain